MNTPVHVFVMSGLVQAPWGIDLAGILKSTSGFPFNAAGGGVDSDGDGIFDDRLVGTEKGAFVTDPFFSIDPRLAKEASAHLCAADAAAGAVDQIDAWLESPSLVLLSESEAYWPALRRLLLDWRVEGPLVHDARVVALCLRHAVDELWTLDRDFSRFPSVSITNPQAG